MSLTLGKSAGELMNCKAEIYVYNGSSWVLIGYTNGGIKFEITDEYVIAKDGQYRFVIDEALVESGGTFSVKVRSLNKDIANLITNGIAIVSTTQATETALSKASVTYDIQYMGDTTNTGKARTEWPIRATGKLRNGKVFDMVLWLVAFKKPPFEIPNNEKDAPFFEFDLNGEIRPSSSKTQGKEIGFMAIEQ